MASNNDTISKTLIVAISLCLVCSVIVAGAAVSLKEKQATNKLNDKRANILIAADLLQKGDGQDVEKAFAEKITPQLVNLAEGRLVTDAEKQEVTAAGLNPEVFDQKKSSKTPELSRALDGAEDIASIKRLEKFAEIYMVKENGTVILPIHGYGLWSTLYGFIALEKDLETVVGLGFYAHAETPGLGGEVDNPSWKALWKGKKLHNESGDLVLQVVKGKATPGSQHDIDGLSGATLTSRGVSNLVQFWLGENAFGKLLANMKAEQAEQVLELPADESAEEATQEEQAEDAATETVDETEEAA